MRKALFLLCLALIPISARADLTIVQKIEGAGAVTADGSAPKEMTIKIKGDKVRIDTSPQMSTIIDSKSGDILNLMNDQKKFLRVSGEQARAVAETAARFRTKPEPTEKAKLVATGKKETINGYEAEEYVADTPQFKATYWIAPSYPDGAAIVKQLQAITPQSWGLGADSMPDYRDFPGVPVRTRINLGGKEIVSTLTSANLDPVSEAEFAPPVGFEEMKMPDIGKMFGGGKPDAKEKRPKP
ncbi:MAG: DUF4412 domain-containing protein [Verrucomicrobiota bacterium]|nr:DUF4412 domain-containing protein [Verrucomicrobiota bacterium]